MNKVKNELKQLAFDVNKAEITSHIKDGTLDQWIKSWRAAFLQEVEKLPDYPTGVAKEEVIESVYFHSPKRVCICTNCNTGVVEGVIGQRNFCNVCGYKLVR